MMHSNDISYTEIVALLVDHAETIAFDMMVDCKKTGPRVYGDCHGKASVVVSGKDVGLVGFWQGQRDKQGGNLINLIEIAQGMSHGEAVRYAKSHYLGIQDRPFTEIERREWAKRKEAAKQAQEQRETAAQRKAEQRTASVREVWLEAKPTGDNPAGIYLQKRICDHDFPPSLKYHPNLFCEDIGKAQPALIAGVQKIDRKLVAIWRIFLNQDGTNFLHDGVKLKKGWGPSAGGCVRLTPITKKWNIGEGLESTLGAQALSKFQGSWASALSTSGMMGLEIPGEVEHVTIWSDGDLSKFRKGTEDELAPPPGQSAAQVLQKRILESGRTCTINEPPAGSDWADVWEKARG